MSLETIIASKSYVGNESDDAYPIPFQFLSPAHIQVVLKKENEDDIVLTVGQFTVTQLSNGQGSFVTTAPVHPSYDVVVSRVTPTIQPIVLEDGALIPAKTLERGFDRLAMIAQETRGYTASQEIGPHGTSHSEGGGDLVLLALAQVTGLVPALASKALGATLEAHLADTENPHAVTKAQVGLDAVDNTSDTDKPISADTQEALDAKADKLLAVTALTGASETLALTDAGKLVTMDNASANTLTVPPHSSVAFSVGCQILVKQLGAGATTIAAGSGVTIRSRGSLLALAGQYAIGVLIKDDTDVWTFTGDRA